ncbi:MAG: carbon-nitrogen hydrolase family protein [Deltaproteobacteria bacterium]|nr:carbon-nitrogen hydrolase family protein [Deltaproteobacteria bacterium]MBW2447140.1 carbon-nitrogen hydrolase family protein [Deltaproteobacteria bacterium]
MRAAVVQMCSTDDLAANLKAAEGFVREAALAGAEFVALPENFAFMRREGQPMPCRQEVEGEIIGQVRAWARELGVWILAGTFPEVVAGDPARFHNTSVLVSAAGAVEAVYRKIHLFDVDLSASGGGEYRESTHVAPGSELVVAETPFGGLGLSVCYDLRFPELYREMAKRGARFLAVPSAFTPHTGKDHWEVLLRARAIENQSFVLAPAQAGRHGPDRASYGRSMIIDPWGLVLAQAGDRPGVVVADCRVEDLEQIRAGLPALRHRRV